MCSEHREQPQHIPRRMHLLLQQPAPTHCNTHGLAQPLLQEGSVQCSTVCSTMVLYWIGWKRGNCNPLIGHRMTATEMMWLNAASVGVHVHTNRHHIRQALLMKPHLTQKIALPPIGVRTPPLPLRPALIVTQRSVTGSPTAPAHTLSYPQKSCSATDLLHLRRHLRRWAFHVRKAVGVVHVCAAA
jgi:hypothetical protein